MAAAGKPALWEHKTKASAPGRSSGVPREKAARALGVQSGAADGLGARCQPGNTECSFTVQRVHLGGEPLHSRPLWDGAFATWKATSHHCSLRCPSVGARRLAPFSSCFSLSSVLPPAGWDALLLLPPVSCTRLLEVPLETGQEKKGYFIGGMSL